MSSPECGAEQSHAAVSHSTEEPRVLEDSKMNMSQHHAFMTIKAKHAGLHWQKHKQ